MTDPLTQDPIYNIIRGKWTYRSLHNNPAIETNFNDLEFGRGVFTFGTVAYDQIYDSEADFGDGYKLTIKGELIRKDNAVSGVRWRGEGIPGTLTDGWIYDYEGALTQRWPEGIDQAHVIVGTVIRTVRHGDAPAGYVGSFYMVRQA